MFGTAWPRRSPILAVFSAIVVSAHAERLAAQVDANEVLAAALAEAERTDREDIAPIFFKDFVDAKIDVDEMEGGQELMDSYTEGPAVGGGSRGVTGADRYLTLTTPEAECDAPLVRSLDLWSAV